MWKVTKKCAGNLMIDEGYLVRLFLQTHLSAVSVSGDRVGLLFLVGVKGEIFTREMSAQLLGN